MKISFRHVRILHLQEC